MTTVTAAALCLGALGCLLASMRPKAGVPLKKFLRAAAGCIALSLALEGGLFQYDALASRGLSPEALDMKSARIDENGALFTGLSLEMRYVDAVFSGPTGVAAVSFAVQDAAYAKGMAEAYSCKINPGGGRFATAHARVESHGAATALRISYPQDCTLLSVTVNAPQAYRFSLPRLMCLLLPLLLVSLILCFGLWKIPLNRGKTAHRAVYALCCVFCLLLCVWVHVLCTPYDRTLFPYTRALEYPFENGAYQYRSLTHAVMFDALVKGQAHMDVPVDEALLALENPYDPTQRAESGAPVMFDYALHEGRYYAYFGLTPVLVFYAPFCLLTGYLPSYTTAACFFAMLSMLAAFLCVWEMARRFVKAPSLLMLCLTAGAVALGSNVLMVQACADRYYLSIASMQAFFFLTLWAGFAAVRQKKRLPRTAWFALCAVFTFLCVWSRATGALAAAGWIAPLFILVLCSRRHGWRRKLADAAGYLVPLCAGAAAIMAYNAARFGSPLTFGQTWQLTLEDIHYNRLSLRDIGHAIYYYFFDGLRLTGEFPYITTAAAYINRSGNWFYGVANAGALTMPVTWGLLLICCLPEKKRRGQMAVYLTAALFTLPLALSGYAIAGVAQRYVCDIQPTLCLAGGMVLLALSSRDIQENRGHTAVIHSALCVCTCLIALALVFSNYRNFVMQYAPDRYLQLYTLFTLL